MQKPEFIKIAIVGDQGIGKRSLLTSGYSFPKRLSPLYIPIEFNSIQVKTGANDWKVLCYDSLPRSETLSPFMAAEFTSHVISGADVILMCYSCVNPESLNNLKLWYRQISLYLSPGAILYLVGINSELETKPLIKEVNEFSRHIGVEEHIKVSMRNRDSVRRLFSAVVHKTEKLRNKNGDASTNIEISPTPIRSPTRKNPLVGSVKNSHVQGLYSRRLNLVEGVKEVDNSHIAPKKLLRQPDPLSLEDILVI